MKKETISIRIGSDIIQILEAYIKSWDGLNRSALIEGCIIVALHNLDNLEEIDSYFQETFQRADEYDSVMIHSKIREIAKLEEAKRTPMRTETESDNSN